MKAKWFSAWVLSALVLSSCFDSEDPNRQLNEDISQINNYLNTIGQLDEALINQRGIHLIFQDYGQLAPPNNNQVVTVHYQGRLFPNGTVFDTGTITDELDQLRPLGLPYALADVMTGSQLVAYIPSDYGFGEAGTTGVPPNSILVYNLWLEKTELSAIEKSRAVSDSTAIKNYLDDNELPFTFHPSGLFYHITEQGTGAAIAPYGLATFQYKLTNLNSPTTVIEEGNLAQPVFGLIDGFRVGLPLLNVGTKATLYIPSRLAYGPNGTSGVPANANLIFELTINENE